MQVLPAPPSAVDLKLEKVLGDMHKKTFELNHMNTLREPLYIAPTTTVLDSLKRVLRFPSVCSKRFLTTKVDRLNWRCMLNLRVANKKSFGYKSNGTVGCQRNTYKSSLGESYFSF
ncbi:hypothetical protein RDI58_003401 [Solanum bulbocastanum]|uniref:Uncharacterized protein n=1 Tax=Solanum bulbocastanum TaxID=147425 RepID=A0AAN8UHF7_SOLBU